MLIHLPPPSKSVARSSPADHPFSQARSYLKASRGWEAQAQLVFEASAPQQKIRAVLSELRKLPQVVHLEGGPAVEEALVRELPALTQDLVLREYRVSGPGEFAAKIALFRESWSRSWTQPRS